MPLYALFYVGFPFSSHFFSTGYAPVNIPHKCEIVSSWAEQKLAVHPRKRAYPATGRI
jgi:hypothetical protein